MMRLAYTESRQSSRAEVRDWLRTHVPRTPLASFDTAEGFQAHREWERVLSRGSFGMVTWPKAQGAVLTSAEPCGLVARMLEMGIEYVKTREQFGVPIGNFQAVKHLLANIRMRLEFARPAVYRAAAIEEDACKGLDGAVSHAKMAATDAAVLAAENVIQVFGAMGYAFEADLHFFMKRSWALAGVWDDREYYLKRMEDALFAEDACIGPGATYSATGVN